TRSCSSRQAPPPASSLPLTSNPPFWQPLPSTVSLRETAHVKSLCPCRLWSRELRGRRSTSVSLLNVEHSGPVRPEGGVWARAPHNISGGLNPRPTDYESFQAHPGRSYRVRSCP